ncbi:hypothetical protein XI09_04180 [Bradyrhizobium sp. CCBAU 11386]|uniref:hypothetical protein n=1 Tax=Bradyrhizobium sp. CCBAU 11386 TaxID=1630837 RepID=UPI003FA46A2F|nr:hypothetical protein [Bradyrhizobium sp. CCBAU 11386]
MSQSKPYRRIIGDHPQSRSLATALCGARVASGFATSYTTPWDTTILLVINDGLAVFHAGSGITALSEPEAEYEEVLAKAQRIFDTFRFETQEPF